MTEERATHRDTIHPTIKEATQAVTEVSISSDPHMHQESDDPLTQQVAKITEQVRMKIGDNLEHRGTSLAAVPTAENHSTNMNVLIDDRKSQAVTDENRGDNLQSIKPMTSIVDQAAVTDACQFNTSMVTRGPKPIELEPCVPAATDHQQEDVSSGDYKGDSNVIFPSFFKVPGTTAAKRGVLIIDVMTMEPMPMTYLHTDHHEDTDLQALDDTVAEQGASTINVAFTEPAIEPHVTDTTSHHAEPSLSGEVQAGAKKDVTQDLHVDVIDAGDVVVTGRSVSTCDDVTSEPFRPSASRGQKRDYSYREFEQTDHGNQFEVLGVTATERIVLSIDVVTDGSGTEPSHPPATNDGNDEHSFREYNPAASMGNPDLPHEEYEADRDVAVAEGSAFTMDVLTTEPARETGGDLAITEDHEEIHSGLKFTFDAFKNSPNTPREGHLQFPEVTIAGRSCSKIDVVTTQPRKEPCDPNMPDHNEEDLPLRDFNLQTTIVPRTPHDHHLEALGATVVEVLTADDIINTEPVMKLCSPDSPDRHKRHVGAEAAVLTDAARSGFTVDDSSITEHNEEAHVSLEPKLGEAPNDDRLGIADEHHVEAPDAAFAEDVSKVDVMTMKSATPEHRDYKTITPFHEFKINSVKDQPGILHEADLKPPGISTASVMTAEHTEVHLQPLHVNLGNGEQNQPTAMDDHGVQPPSWTDDADGYVDQTLGPTFVGTDTSDSRSMSDVLNVVSIQNGEQSLQPGDGASTVELKHSASAAVPSEDTKQNAEVNIWSLLKDPKSALGLVFQGRRSDDSVEGGTDDTAIFGSKATDDVPAVESSHVATLGFYPDGHHSSSDLQAATVPAFHTQLDSTLPRTPVRDARNSSVNVENGMSSLQSFKMLTSINPEDLRASLELAMSQELIYGMKGKSSSTSVIAEHVEHGRKC